MSAARPNSAATLRPGFRDTALAPNVAPSRAMIAMNGWASTSATSGGIARPDVVTTGGPDRVANAAAAPDTSTDPVTSR